MPLATMTSYALVKRGVRFLKEKLKKSGRIEKRDIFTAVKQH